MKNIKEVRKALKLTQAEFSDQLNITQSYLSAIETGRKQASINLIADLFAMFNVSAEWYFKGYGEMFTVQKMAATETTIIKALVDQIEVNLNYIKEILLNK